MRALSVIVAGAILATLTMTWAIATAIGNVPVDVFVGWFLQSLLVRIALMATCATLGVFVGGVVLRRALQTYR